MRRATAAVQTKTQRQRLPVREWPYYHSVGPRITLGYVRNDPLPGTWVVREKVGGLYKRRALGAADDVGLADGRTVLTFEQAARAAADGGLTATVRTTEPLTVKRAVDAYLVALAKRSRHVGNARYVADRHILPTLGTHRVAALTTRQLETWRSGLLRDDTADDGDRRRRSQDTANRIVNIVKAALNHAFADEANRIPTDAAWRRLKPFKDAARAREDHFDAAQVRVLIAKAATFDASLATLMEAGYLTGARYGELTALTCGDFDARTGTLSIRRGKTGARHVTLSQEAVALFKRLTSKRPARAVLLPRQDGAPWQPKQQLYPFKRAAKLAQLPASASFYTLRHSHISRAIEAGMPLSLLAENCGTSLVMIQRNYAKMLASTRRDLVDASAPRLRRVK